MTYRAKPRLTREELGEIVEFYHARFPTWRVVRDNSLVREQVPIIQGITFERLPRGEYRPTGHIRVLVAPEDFWVFELPQYLNVKVRQVNRRQHPEFRDRVVQAIRLEFVPNVDRPLIAEDVLELYEHKATPTDLEAYSLAALNAYLGHEERALYWCSRFTQLVNEVGNPWQDCDYKRRAFLEQLEQWMKAGEAKQQLDRVLQEERRKWGLA
jgi:hypothetical protein